MPEVQATIVFEKVWAAIHEKCPACIDTGPHAECQWCLGSGRKYKYIKNKGSSRSSKTYSIAQAVYLYSIKNKQKRVSVFRDTKIDCKETVGKDMSTIYPTMPFADTVTFNKTESIYHFITTKSTIEIEGTDDANRIHGYNGDVTWFCEPYDISEEVFNQLDMRTTDFVILDLNPKEDHWSDRLELNPRCLVIHSTFKDNPFCPPEQKKKILSYQPVSMTEVVLSKALTEHEGKIYDTQANKLGFTPQQIRELARCQENERQGTASRFNWSVYGLGEKAERPNRIFHWTEISDGDYQKLDAVKYYGVDWGVVDPWGILEAKYYDGGLYLHELNYDSENQVREKLTFDQQAEVNKDLEKGVVRWLFNQLNISKKCYVIVDNNRVIKLQALQEMGYNNTFSALKPPGSIIDGINQLLNLKVYYTSSSSNLKYEQENYSREVDRYGIVLEEPEDKNNHLIDPARYIVSFMVFLGVIKPKKA